MSGNQWGPPPGQWQQPPGYGAPPPGRRRPVPRAQPDHLRRLELQASCLGNVFLGANRASYGITGYAYSVRLYDVNGSGHRPYGPFAHGSPKNHGAWSRAGFASRNPVSCNTWAASPSRVS